MCSVKASVWLMSTITAAIWLLVGKEDSLVWVFCAYWLAPNLKLQGLACWCVIYTQMLGTVVCGPIGGLWWVVKTVGNAGEMDLASLLIQWQVFTCYTARTIIDPRCRAEVTVLALLCICLGWVRAMILPGDEVIQAVVSSSACILGMEPGLY